MVFQHISWIPSYSEAYVSKLLYSLPGAHDRALLSPLLNIICATRLGTSDLQVQDVYNTMQQV